MGKTVSGEDSRTKGKLFEQQVARFLEKRGWKPTLGRPFDGRIAVRQHDCDIFAQKTSLGWSLVVVACFLLVAVGVVYWSGSFPTECLPRETQGFVWLLNLLGPFGFLFGLFAVKMSTKYVWVECKNLQQSIKRDLIIKLQYQFRDVRKFGSWECWLVSTSRFDEDALAHAKAHKVTCYLAVESGGRNMALHRVESKTGDV
jgi:hypothetical protein